MVFALEDRVLIDLIGDTDHVIFVGDPGELADVGFTGDRAGRIGRRINDKRRGVVGDGVLDSRGIERQILAQPDRYRLAADELCQRVVGDKARIRDDDLLAGVNMSSQREV